MKLKSVNLVNKAEYLNTYEATYETEEDTEGIRHNKVYEVISRDPNMTIETFGKNTRDKAEAVGIIAFSEKGDKVLLQREFRLSCNDWVYNFPGGLSDGDETIEETAFRELKEETGLDIKEVLAVLPPAYTAVGLGNERAATVICIADGEFAPSTSVYEEIEAKWFTAEEIFQLIENKEPMSLRSQTVLFMWAQINLIK
jgi:ADP-ribose pyrophosphatase